MKSKLFLSVIILLMAFTMQVQEVNEKYIEVTGTSEIEIVPDKIHYLIEIREYFEEEFDGKLKPEQYRTKVPLQKIEQGVRKVLSELNVPQNAIRTQEIGDYRRQQGQDFLVSKRLDITLTDFNPINERYQRNQYHVHRQAGEQGYTGIPQERESRSIESGVTESHLSGGSIGQEIRRCYPDCGSRKPHRLSIGPKQCDGFRCSIV